MILNVINKMKLTNKIRNKTYLFLRWTEKWTKTDMIYLTKGGFWLTIGQIISSLSALLLSIAFANLIPKEVYGNYKYILSIVSILSISTLGEINTSLTQAIANGYKGSLIYPLQSKMKWGLLGSISSIIIAVYYFTVQNNPLAISFLISAIFLPIMDPLNVYNALLSGKKLFKNYTKYNVIVRILSTLSTIVVLFFTQNIALIMCTYFISNTVIRAIILYLVTKKYTFSKEKDPTIISYGKHLTFMGIINTIAGQLDKLITYYFLGPIDLAVYSFAIAMPEQIKSIFKNINTLAFPKFSSQKGKKLDKHFLQKLGKYISLTVIIFLGYVVFAPLLYKILFPQYTEAVFYSQVFALSLLAFPSGILITKLQSNKEQNILYQFNFIISTVQILLLLSLVYTYGLMGIILARVITRFVALFLSIFMYIKS